MSGVVSKFFPESEGWRDVTSSREATVTVEGRPVSLFEWQFVGYRAMRDTEDGVTQIRILVLNEGGDAIHLLENGRDILGPN